MRQGAEGFEAYAVLRQPAGAQAVIEVTGLSKRFGAVQALNGVGFSAPDGTITGILGPNGAGKTTLMRILATLIDPDAGQALVDGHDVTVETQIARRRFGLLSDAKGLYSRLTARENVDYFARLYGIAKADADSRRDALFEQLDMTALAGR